jgi:hypothetical protein
LQCNILMILWNSVRDAIVSRKAKCSIASWKLKGRVAADQLVPIGVT